MPRRPLPLATMLLLAGCAALRTGPVSSSETRTVVGKIVRVERVRFWIGTGPVTPGPEGYIYWVKSAERGGTTLTVADIETCPAPVVSDDLYRMDLAGGGLAYSFIRPIHADNSGYVVTSCAKVKG